MPEEFNHDLLEKITPTETELLASKIRYSITYARVLLWMSVKINNDKMDKFFESELEEYLKTFIYKPKPKTKEILEVFMRAKTIYKQPKSKKLYYFTNDIETGKPKLLKFVEYAKYKLGVK